MAGVEVDQNLVASHLLHLQNRGVIMHIVDFYKSGDQFEARVMEVMG